MKRGQSQLPLHHIISGRFAYFLALGVIENIILYLKTKPDIFTEQTRRFRLFIASPHRESARLRTSCKEHGRLLADNVEIDFLGEMEIADVGKLQKFTICQILPQARDDIDNVMVTGHAHLHQRCCKQIIACQYGYFIIENGINGELSTAFSTFVHYIIVHKAGVMKKFQRNRSMQGCRTYLAKKLRSQKHQNGAHHLPVLLPDMRNYAVQQKVGTGEGTFKKLLEVLQFLRNRRFYQ